MCLQCKWFCIRNSHSNMAARALVRSLKPTAKAVSFAAGPAPKASGNPDKGNQVEPVTSNIAMVTASEASPSSQLATAVLPGAAGESRDVATGDGDASSTSRDALPSRGAVSDDKTTAGDSSSSSESSSGEKSDSNSNICSRSSDADGKKKRVTSKRTGGDNVADVNIDTSSAAIKALLGETKASEARKRKDTSQHKAQQGQAPQPASGSAKPRTQARGSPPKTAARATESMSDSFASKFEWMSPMLEDLYYHLIFVAVQFFLALFLSRLVIPEFIKDYVDITNHSTICVALALALAIQTQIMHNTPAMLSVSVGVLYVATRPRFVAFSIIFTLLQLLTIPCRRLVAKLCDKKKHS
ncbi:uncharacterized protein LOC135830008 [Sycon ciliatum]|uniref:uncharacterized protein LOC135830008 n=1 Tax=Sycon ciliatum TaxID=27933 RepID=UPI0031F66DEF